ncbi:MAG TPA: class I SAM-dependent methyltransferase [Candidatus Acidoferrales bacterium]|nr:class I SAM-dependent methyltransferase [Candidatus Acidoferrales bacterium]
MFSAQRTRIAGKSAAILFILVRIAAPLAGQSDAKRDSWQRPNEVMDALQLHAGSTVADIGAGQGYFTFKLAERVGPTGKVLAEDLLAERMSAVREAAAKRNLPQVETIIGTASDPHLPAGALDAILVINAYHEFKDYDAMMRAMLMALKPGGLLGIIDAKDDLGQARAVYQQRHRLPEQMTLDDAKRGGFHFVKRLLGFSDSDTGREYYFLLFEKPKAEG